MPKPAAVLNAVSNNDINLDCFIASPAALKKNYTRDTTRNAATKQNFKTHNATRHQPKH
jgi:hypothetical protein